MVYEKVASGLTFSTGRPNDNIFHINCLAIAYGKLCSYLGALYFTI
jgi:hypothetical protein